MELRSTLTRVMGRLQRFQSSADIATQVALESASTTEYRYLRLIQTAATASGYIELQRLNFLDSAGAFIVPIMTSNSAPSPVVVSSSEQAFGTSTFEAFDRSTATRCHTDTPSSAEWWEVDLGSGNSARPAAVALSFDSATARFITAFDIEGSDTAAWAGEEEILFSSPTFTTSSFQNNFLRVFVFSFDYSNAIA